MTKKKTEEGDPEFTGFSKLRVTSPSEMPPQLITQLMERCARHGIRYRPGGELYVLIEALNVLDHAEEVFRERYERQLADAKLDAVMDALRALGGPDRRY